MKNLIKILFVAPVCIMLLVNTGCKKDKSDPVPSDPVVPPTTVNAHSDPQINITLKGVNYKWIVNDTSDYYEFTYTNVISGTAVYHCEISDDNDMIFSVAKGTHSYTAPCDSHEIVSFFPKGIVGYSYYASNGIQFSYTDHLGYEYTSNTTQTGSNFNIIDTYYFKEFGVNYVRVYATFNCTLQRTPFPDITCSGSGVFTFENYL